jgi:putative addiction module component (TIGR02574 family)
MSAVEEIRAAALALPEEERTALVRDLMDSLDQAETLSDEEAWAEELQARYEAYVRGEVVALDAAESIRQLREDE